MKWIKTLIIVTALVAVGCGVWWFASESDNVSYKTNPAQVRAITRMVELCTMDIHEEIPIKDSINGKWLVARQVVDGRIRFDVEDLRMESRGDTTVVYLPPERVDILENAGAGAYQVLDTWDGKSTLFARTLTASEENAIKKRWQDRVRKRIYDRGHVKRAREKAVAVLTPLLDAMSGSKCFVVVDPAPGGFPE